MTLEKHDLVHELPEFRDQIHEMKMNNAHFAKLFEAYHEVDHEEGFGFIKNIAIDQHVIARNRHFDMFDILKNRPELLGISIDEGTAMIVQGNEFEVMGRGYVIIFDGTFWSREGSDLKTLPPGNQLTRPGCPAGKYRCLHTRTNIWPAG